MTSNKDLNVVRSRQIQRQDHSLVHCHYQIVIKLLNRCLVEPSLASQWRSLRYSDWKFISHHKFSQPVIAYQTERAAFTQRLTHISLLHISWHAKVSPHWNWNAYSLQYQWKPIRKNFWPQTDMDTICEIRQSTNTHLKYSWSILNFNTPAFLFLVQLLGVTTPFNDEYWCANWQTCSADSPWNLSSRSLIWFVSSISWSLENMICLSLLLSCPVIPPRCMNLVNVIRSTLNNLEASRTDLFSFCTACWAARRLSALGGTFFALYLRTILPKHNTNWRPVGQ